MVFVLCKQRHDNLDVDFELVESEAAGHKLPDEWREMQNDPYPKLYTETAKLIFKQLEKLKPE